MNDNSVRDERTKPVWVGAPVIDGNVRLHTLLIPWLLCPNFQAMVLARHDDPPDLVLMHRLWWERGYVEKTLTECIALHVVVEGETPPEVVARLLELCPESVRVKTRNSEGVPDLLPLHSALRRPYYGGRGLNMSVVQLLFERHPDAVKEPTADGALPLHVALATMARNPYEYFGGMDVVRFLIQRHPTAVRVQETKSGKLPIHLLLPRMVGLELADVEMLVEPYPESLEVKDDQGCLPIHVAASNPKLPLPVLQYLVAKNPAAVRMRDLQGELPIHIAVRFGAPMEHLQLLVEYWSDSLLEEESHRVLPLHVVVVRSAVLRADPALPTIQYLVDSCPASLHPRLDNGLNLLHYASGLNAPEDVIRLLASQRPESLRERCAQGWLPLHFAAAFRGPRVGMVRLLVELCPAALHEPDVNRCLPLHFAVSANSTLVSWRAEQATQVDDEQSEFEVVQFLVERAPDTLLVADNRGWLPLHYAVVQSDASMWTCRLLVEQGPAALWHVDDEGRLPLHLAMSSVQASDVGPIMMAEWPEAGRMPDQQGNLPLHIALQASVPMRNLRPLVEAHPESLLVRNNDDLLPTQVLIASMQEEPPLETLTFLIECRPASLQVQDAAGRCLLHTALESSNPTFPLVELLVKHWHDALRLRDRQRFLPFHVAAIRNHELDIVFFLVRSRPEVVVL